MTNLIGDQLDTTTNGIVATYPHVEGEKNQRRAISRKASTTVIGSASRERDYPGFVTGSWQSILAPTGNPEPIVNEVRAEVTKILQMVDVMATLQ